VTLLSATQPTTGLDSRAALVVMQGIQNIARTGRTVLCTIHQPSADVFFFFDRLLLLKTGGFTVYNGEVGKYGSTLVKYFETATPDAPKLPKHMNPASWMLDVISANNQQIAKQQEQAQAQEQETQSQSQKKQSRSGRASRSHSRHHDHTQTHDHEHHHTHTPTATTVKDYADVYKESELYKETEKEIERLLVKQDAPPPHFKHQYAANYLVQFREVLKRQWMRYVMFSWLVLYEAVHDKTSNLVFILVSHLFMCLALPCLALLLLS